MKNNATSAISNPIDEAPVSPADAKPEAGTVLYRYEYQQRAIVECSGLIPVPASIVAEGPAALKEWIRGSEEKAVETSQEVVDWDEDVKGSFSCEIAAKGSGGAAIEANTRQEQAAVVQASLLAWQDIERTSPDGRFIVVLEHIGEGIDGDYNQADPDDAPMVRFSVFERTEEDPRQEVAQSSYCTSLPITTEQAKLVAFADQVLARVMEGKTGKDLAILTWVEAAYL